MGWVLVGGSDGGLTDPKAQHAFSHLQICFAILPTNNSFPPLLPFSHSCVKAQPKCCVVFLCCHSKKQVHPEQNKVLLLV